MEHKMNKFIVITSIFNPTEAVKKFSNIKEFKTIVVGDKKSPEKYDCENVIFLPVSQTINSKLETVLPYNHYCRKMLGYIYAIQHGAELIYDTDDDNYPKEKWDIPSFNGNFPCLSSKNDFANVYKCYTDKHIWPRGYPLELLKQDENNYNIGSLPIKKQNIGVWQSIVDNEPDVDAIYRLVDNSLCEFKTGNPVVLAKDTVCPFNSQATAFKKELFPLLYLPTTVTFRFTDILRGLVAQPIMWNAGFSLGFTEAQVVQERNVHNYLKDFESEIPCYLFAQKIIEYTKESIKSSNSISDNLYETYCLLEKKDIVKKDELIILETWLNDIKNYL